MGLFDRSKSTTNLTEQNEQLNVAQDVSGAGAGSIGFAGGSATVVTTDQGAIGAGRDIALEGIHSAQSNFEEVANLGRDVIAAGADQNRAVAGTLADVARDTTQFAERVVSEGLASGDRARTDAFHLAGDTVRDVLADVGAARGDIIGLADRSRGDAFDLSRDVLADVGAARGDIIGLADRSRGAAFDFAGDVTGDVIQAQREARSDLLSFAGDSQRSVIDAASSFLDRSIEAVQQAGQGFVDAAGAVFARQSTNTDARLESVTKNALIVAAVLGGAALLLPVFRR